jgi:hypothetical protein
VKKDDNSMMPIEEKDSLIGVKCHPKIEYEDEDNNLFVYLQKQYDSSN